MGNPLRQLAPALRLLADTLQILPASGGAGEYLQRPDQDEPEDALVHRGEERVTAFLEDPEPPLSTLYRPTPPLYRSDLRLFRFFIDGSLRTYFLGTAIEGERSFPAKREQLARFSQPDGNFEIIDFDVPDIFNRESESNPRNKARRETSRRR